MEWQQCLERTSTNQSIGLTVSLSEFTVMAAQSVHELIPAKTSAPVGARSGLGARVSISVLPRQTLTTRDFLGGDSGRVIPDPIPNSVVKPSNVDGTAEVTLWESRTLPGSYSESPWRFFSRGFRFSNGLPRGWRQRRGRVASGASEDGTRHHRVAGKLPQPARALIVPRRREREEGLMAARVWKAGVVAALIALGGAGAMVPRIARARVQAALDERCHRTLESVCTFADARLAVDGVLVRDLTVRARGGRYVARAHRVGLRLRWARLLFGLPQQVDVEIDGVSLRGREIGRAHV